MSVTSEISKITYASVGLERYDFPFALLVEGDLEVLSFNKDALEEEKLAPGEDYSVTLNETGGYITLTERGLAKTPAGRSVTLRRHPDALQEADFGENETIYASTIVRMADKLTHMIQSVREAQSRAVTFPAGTDRIPSFKEIAGTISAADKNAQAAQISAETARTHAEEAKAAADASAIAQKWAANPQGEEVAEGKFSAYHYALEAKETGNLANMEEALAGTNDAKVMTPLLSKAAAVFFAAPDYSKKTSKPWNTANLADKNGFVYLSSTYGETEGLPVTLEVASGANMAGAVKVVHADCQSLSIQGTFCAPIPKGCYFKATGGFGTRSLIFVPLKGEG